MSGRTAGTRDGFGYSEANKNSGINWSDKHMFEYLVNPQKCMPGMKMAGAGIKCTQSDTVEKGGNAKQGAPLWGVIGRTAGTYDGFGYSEANKNSGINWSDKHMFEYLVNPQKCMPGMKMAGAGVKCTQSDMVEKGGNAKQ